MGNHLIATMWIDGQPVDTKRRTVIHDPGDVATAIGEMALGSAEDVEHAVQAATRAWPTWAQVSPNKRGELLVAVNDYIEHNIDALTRQLVLENGKVATEAKSELMGSMQVLRYYASLADEVNRETQAEDGRGQLILRRQPVGVVSVIVPWNSPIYLGFLMLAPALMAGNCVIVKPSTFSPLALTEILIEMSKSLPNGVLNVIPGSGSEVGGALTTHPGIRKVSFTGSTEVGKVILRDAAGTVKNVTMELGGNDAAVVLDDVDVDRHLVRELLEGVYSTAGQICYGVKRIYVHQKHYDRFVEAFTAEAAAIRVGHGLDPAVSMGPVNNRQQYDFVRDLIDSSKASGAEVKPVGQFAEGINPEAGYFILPTVVYGAKQSDRIVQKEQFGPVIPILPFETDEEAVLFANDTDFGLGNSVWSRDFDHALRVARQMQSGSVFINVHRLGASGVDMPFGGFKHSGIGRGHGIVSLHEQMELQSIIHRTDMGRV